MFAGSKPIYNGFIITISATNFRRTMTIINHSTPMAAAKQNASPAPMNSAHFPPMNASPSTAPMNASPSAALVNASPSTAPMNASPSAALVNASSSTALVNTSSSTALVNTAPDEKTTRENCVLVFKLMEFVLFPEIKKYMSRESMVLSEDNRINIKILTGGGPKKLKKKNKHIRKKLDKTNLNVVLMACNKVSHVELNTVWHKKDAFVQSFVDMCQEMGATEAADVLKNYVGPSATKTPPLFLIKTPNDELVWQNVQLFSMLVLHVSPSVNKYAATLTQDKDPFEVLKLLKQMGVTQPNLFGLDTVAITSKSFDGRNTVCHSKRKQLARDANLYVDSWGKLCQKVGERTAAKKIAIMKKKMDLRTRLMAKLKSRSHNKKWVVTPMENA